MTVAVNAPPDSLAEAGVEGLTFSFAWSPYNGHHLVSAAALPGWLAADAWRAARGGLPARAAVAWRDRGCHTHEAHPHLPLPPTSVDRCTTGEGQQRGVFQERHRQLGARHPHHQRRLERAHQRLHAGERGRAAGRACTHARCVCGPTQQLLLQDMSCTAPAPAAGPHVLHRACRRPSTPRTAQITVTGLRIDVTATRANNAPNKYKASARPTAAWQPQALACLPARPPARLPASVPTRAPPSRLPARVPAGARRQRRALGRAGGALVRRAGQGLPHLLLGEPSQIGARLLSCLAACPRLCHWLLRCLAAWLQLAPTPAAPRLAAHVLLAAAAARPRRPDPHPPGRHPAAAARRGHRVQRQVAGVHAGRHEERQPRPAPVSGQRSVCQTLVASGKRGLRNARKAGGHTQPPPSAPRLPRCLQCNVRPLALHRHRRGRGRGRAAQRRAAGLRPQRRRGHDVVEHPQRRRHQAAQVQRQQDPLRLWARDQPGARWERGGGQGRASPLARLQLRLFGGGAAAGSVYQVLPRSGQRSTRQRESACRRRRSTSTCCETSPRCAPPGCTSAQ